MYNVQFSKEAKKNIQKLTLKIQKQIKTSILELSEDPSKGKALTHELKGLLSYRSGNYRIIYEIHKKEILIIVLTVGNRKDVYTKATRKQK